MNTKLYVGNIAFSASEQDLADLFAQYGTLIDMAFMKDPETQRFRGFAFVTMETPEGAQKAIEALDGLDFQGRALRVNEARPKEDRGYAGGHYHGGCEQGNRRERGEGRQ